MMLPRERSSICMLLLTLSVLLSITPAFSIPARAAKSRTQSVISSLRQSPTRSIVNDGLPSLLSQPPVEQKDTAVPAEKKEQVGIVNPAKRRFFIHSIIFAGAFCNVRSLHNYGFLINLCTGNTFRMLMGAVDGKLNDAVFSLSLIVSYIMGTALSQLLLSNRQKKKGLSAVPLILLGLFTTADVLRRFTITASCMVQTLAYGMIHSTAQAITQGGGGAMFAVTGHYSTLGKAIANQDAQQLKQQVQTLLSFVAGVTVSAVFSKAVRISSRVPELTMTGAAFALLFHGCTTTTSTRYKSRSS